MRRVITVIVAALIGAVAGSVVRQSVLRERETQPGELVLAAHPAALLAGTAAGLLLPRFRATAAFVVAANVGANMPMGARATKTEGAAEPPEATEG